MRSIGKWSHFQAIQEQYSVMNFGKCTTTGSKSLLLQTALLQCFREARIRISFPNGVGSHLKKNTDGRLPVVAVSQSTSLCRRAHSTLANNSTMIFSCSLNFVGPASASVSDRRVNGADHSMVDARHRVEMLRHPVDLQVMLLMCVSTLKALNHIGVRRQSAPLTERGALDIIVVWHTCKRSDVCHRCCRSHFAP